MGGATITDVDRMCEAELVREEFYPDAHAERVAALHAAAEHHAAAAVWCAAAAGAIALQKKDELGHGGGFQEWKQNVCLPDGRKISRSTIENYMRMADQMSLRLKLYLAENPNTQLIRYLDDLTNLSDSEKKALAGPAGKRDGCWLEMKLLAGMATEDPDGRAGGELRQIVHEMTTGYSLTQLYFDWGIIKDGRQADLDRLAQEGGGAALEDCRSAEQAQWDRIKTELLSAMARKTYAGLTMAELQDAKELLYDCYNEVLECWKRG